MNEMEFNTHLEKYLTADEIKQLNNALSQKNNYSCLLLDVDKLSKESLLKIYPSLIPHPIVNNAFLFNKEELNLGKSLLFEIGAFYILEPCSVLVNHILNPKEDDIVLDLASAPGGKCIHASFLMHNKGQILANEISSSRAQILSSNIEKYGRKNTIVISSDGKTLASTFKNFFTKIILDAPCSGSGMFRKEPKMREDWTYNKVLSLTPIQKELILQAYDMLAPGGEMIYSTCSFSYEEDEEIIQFLLDNTNALLIDIPDIEGAYRSKMSETIHLFPHLFIGEGHYIAKIKKPGIMQNTKLSINILKEKNMPVSLYDKGSFYINNAKELFLSNYAINLNKIHVLRYGIKIGQIDKKLGLIYDHAFARIDLNVLKKIEVNEDEAISFIYGLPIKKDNAQNYVILTYLGVPFALGKGVNGLIKNHYPKGLRKKLQNNCN